MKPVLTALASASLLCSSAAPALAQAEPSGFSFVALEVADVARAEAFYVGTLGMKRLMTISKPTDTYQKYAYGFAGTPPTNPVLILIHYDHPTADQNRSSGAKLGLRVSDARAAGLKAQAAGFAVIRVASADAKGPVTASVVRDPDGVVVELVQLRQP